MAQEPDILRNFGTPVPKKWTPPPDDDFDNNRVSHGKPAIKVTVETCEDRSAHAQGCHDKNKDDSFSYSSISRSGSAPDFDKLLTHRSPRTPKKQPNRKPKTLQHLSVDTMPVQNLNRVTSKSENSIYDLCNAFPSPNQKRRILQTEVKVKTSQKQTDDLKNSLPPLVLTGSKSPILSRNSPAALSPRNSPSEAEYRIWTDSQLASPRRSQPKPRGLVPLPGMSSLKSWNQTEAADIPQKQNSIFHRHNVENNYSLR